MERIQIYGLILLLPGLALRYWMNRRRFNRRNVAGLQTFKNYEQANIILYLEMVARIVAKLLIWVGIFFFAVGLFNRYMANKYREQQKQSATHQ